METLLAIGLVVVWIAIATLALSTAYSERGRIRPSQNGRLSCGKGCR